MTIEYTYPEQKPTGARVLTEYVQYGIIAHPATVQVPLEIAHNAVPEVCEAMMRLAGHEWPTRVELAAESQCAIEKAIGERLIERIRRVYHENSSAENIVREECGLQ